MKATGSRTNRASSSSSCTTSRPGSARCSLEPLCKTIFRSCGCCCISWMPASFRAWRSFKQIFQTSAMVTRYIKCQAAKLCKLLWCLASLCDCPPLSPKYAPMQGMPNGSSGTKPSCFHTDCALCMSMSCALPVVTLLRST